MKSALIWCKGHTRTRFAS